MIKNSFIVRCEDPLEGRKYCGIRYEGFEDHLLDRIYALEEKVKKLQGRIRRTKSELKTKNKRRNGQTNQ